MGSPGSVALAISPTVGVYHYQAFVATATFKNAAGSLADPTDVVFRVHSPDGTRTGYATGDAAWAHGSTGVYTLTVVPDAAGTWGVFVFGDGAVEAAALASVQVQPDVFPLLAPNAPTIGAASSVAVAGFTANWAASIADGDHDPATGYLLDVSETADFATRLAGYDGLAVGNVTSYAVTGLSHGTPYYYRVRASNSAGTSGNSTSASLTTLLNVPNAPTLAAISGITTSGFMLDWTAPGTDASHDAASGYALDIATDSGFVSLVSGFNNLSLGNVLTYAVTGLVDNTAFYVRLRATNAGGASANSATQSATTLAAFVAGQLVSRGLPASTNDDFTGAFPAGNAVNSNYHDLWRAQGVASSGSPIWLALDISGLSSGQKASVIVNLLNDSNHWRDDLVAATVANLVTDYTLRGHAGAGGGAAPADGDAGWVTLATVAGNLYSQRMHALDLSSFNWLQVHCTGSTGGAGNSDVALNVNIVSQGSPISDGYLVIGDSIGDAAFPHDNTLYSDSSSVSERVHVADASVYPAILNASVGGWATFDHMATNTTDGNGLTYFATWLSLFPGKHVIIELGTNDANNAPGGFAATFDTNVRAMCDAIVGAGKIPILPTIPWGGTVNLLANVPTLNTLIAAILTDYPTAIAGPDLYAVFNADHTLISGDNIHPTNTGYSTYRDTWASWLETTIYV